MNRKRGGLVVLWPEVKKQGHLPKGDKVSEHLQTGLGGCYVLERQMQLQSLSQTEILRKEGSLKAWLLFHLNSVPHVPSESTSWSFQSPVRNKSSFQTLSILHCASPDDFYLFLLLFYLLTPPTREERPD